MDPLTPPPPAAPAPAAPAAARAPRRLWVIAGLALAALLALVLAAGVGFGTWAWRSDAGTGWVLGQVPGLQTEGLQGALGGRTLTARKITYRNGGNTLVLDDVEIRSLAWRWRPHQGAWVGLAAESVRARQAAWQSAPPPTPAPAPTPPQSLRLPLQLQVQNVALGRLQVDTLPALADLQASGLALGEQGGARHVVKSLALKTDKAAVQASLDIGADAPMTLQATAQAQSVGAAWPWQASVSAQGALAELRASARLAGTAQPGRQRPQLRADGLVRPFAAWPLGELRLSTQELDLASLATGAPETRLAGQVDVQTSGLDREASARVDLANAAPGRWDQGKAPVRRLSAEVRGTPEPLDRLQLRSLLLELGNAESTAGRVRGEGDYRATTGRAEARLSLEQIRPAALDQRAAPMTLSGPVTLSLSGLPAPGAPGAASAAPAPGTAAPLALEAEIKSQLRGRLDPGAVVGGGAAAEVEVTLDTRLADGRVDLRELLARSGGASARLQGRLTRPAPQRWQWQLAGDLKDFDPLPWWPGAPGSAWRKGPHLLNAHLESEASATEAALAAPLSGWPQWAGQLLLQIGPSQVAGVPVKGELRLANQTGSAQATGRLEVANNVLSLDGRPDRAGSADRWRATLDAPALISLAPLVALDPALAAAWAPRAGKLQVELLAEGRGAGMKVQLKTQVDGLLTPTLSLAHADLEARGARSLDAPLSAVLKARGLVQGEQRVDQLSVEVGGSVRSHQLKLLAESPARPPAWFEQLLGARTGTGSRVALNAEGQWQPAPAATPATADRLLPGRWQGRVVELQGRARDGSGQPWLAAADLRASFELDSDGQLRSAQAEAGRLQLPGTALRWDLATWRAGVAGGGLPQWALQAELEPFAVAPLLDRAQPELGWRGDLMLGGQIRLRREARFDADIVLERRSGDLSISEDVRNANARTQSLGLSDLRIGLAAHDGVWHLTQGLAGKQLGEVSGVLSVRTRADLAFPPQDAPIDGVLQVNVARLDAWGAWVPPGWRVGGQVQTTATFGGRVGAPELTGRLTGRNLLLRNALEGVQLSDGVVDVSLQGLRAVIERFEFKGGDGRLNLRGEASLGEAPRAQLQLLAERFVLLGRVDRRVVTSGQATLALDREALKVDGKFTVDEGVIDFSRGGAPGLDDDVTVVNGGRAESPGPGGPSAAPASNRTTSVALEVDLGERLRIKGRGLDTALRGQLRLSTPGGRLAVYGSVRTERGTYAAYSQKLEIERGVLTFTGPVEDPRLDILAVRPNLDVVVGVAVTGSALNPRIRLASEPEMSDTDKLSWLVLGREPEGLGQADTALLQRAAMALLAGENGGGSDALLSRIGLTDFSVRQAGEGDVRETVVSLGKQLSRRWYVGYERSVNATTGSWQLIYRIAQRLTVRAQSGEDNALDVIWSWRFD